MTNSRLCRIASVSSVLLAAGLTGCGGARAPASAPQAEVSTLVIIESIDPWTYNGSPGSIIRTSHYRLFTTQRESAVTRRMPMFLEDCLAAYRTKFVSVDQPLPEPELKLDTYIMRSRPDWVVLTQQLTGNQAPQFLRIPRGGFAFGGKALLFDMGTKDTLGIAGHEGWHQYTQRTLKATLPIWLEEGLATCMEGYRTNDRGEGEFSPWYNTQRYDQLRKAAGKNELQPLAQLLESSPQRVLSEHGGTTDHAITYYAQVWSLSVYLVDGGDHELRSLLENTLHASVMGGPQAYAAQHALRTAIIERQAQYEAFVAKLIEPGSRSAIVQGKSPLAR